MATIFEKASVSLRGPFKPRIMSAVELYEFWSKEHPSLQVKSLYLAANKMIRLGLLKRIRNNVYVNLQAVPAVQNHEIAVHFEPEAVITMHSALYQSGALNNPSRIVTAVIPVEVRRRGSMESRIPGRRMQISTSECDIWGFYIPKKLVSSVEMDPSDAYVLGLPYRMATPEKALLDWIYIGELRRTEVYKDGLEMELTGLPPLDIDLKVFDIKKLNRLARVMDLKSALSDWMEVKKDYDKSNSVVLNMNQNLGF